MEKNNMVQGKELPCEEANNSSGEEGSDTEEDDKYTDEDSDSD